MASQPWEEEEEESSRRRKKERMGKHVMMKPIPEEEEERRGKKIKKGTEVAHTSTMPFMCDICVEPKPLNESFNIEGCTHFYCTECVIKYVVSKLHDNVTRICCPVSKCPGLLKLEYCCGILPPEVFERWGNALCESVILGFEKFYCPFKDCSALLINDGGEGEGEVMVTQSECPYCNRLFCAQCEVPWHSGIDCAQFQNFDKDERQKEGIMLMELADKKGWKRCPKCRFYVARRSGCDHLRCRSISFIDMLFLPIFFSQYDIYEFL